MSKWRVEWSEHTAWLCALGSVALFAGAFSTGFRWLGVLGAAAAMPYLWQVSRVPLFHWIAIVAMAGNAVAAVALLRRRPDVAFAALSPALMVFAALSVFALRGFHLVAPGGPTWPLQIPTLALPR